MQSFVSDAFRPIRTPGAMRLKPFPYTENKDGFHLV